MTDLLPCPFCGSCYVSVLQGPTEKFGSCCRDCDVWRDDRLDTPDDAAAAWNTRAPDPRLAAAREALAECLGVMSTMNGPAGRVSFIAVRAACTKASEALAMLEGEG